MAYAVLAAVEHRIPDRSSVIGGHYLRPWQDGSIVQIPITERRHWRHYGSRVEPTS
jgi:hypothetical protein